MSKEFVLNCYAAFGENEWHRLSWPEGVIAGYGVRPQEVAPFLERHGLTTVALLADTGFAAAPAQQLAELAESDPKAFEAAMEIIISTADDPSLLGASIHLLYVGQKRT